jgi:CheY-like chemotaxis protein
MLGAISGYADLLSRKLADRDPKLAKYARTILAGANRAAGLTSKLLTFARRGKYRSLAVDIHLLLREVMAALRGTVESGVILKEELSASTAQVLGDPDQLRDALLDVAVNARDALPEDGEIVFSTSVISVDEAFSRAHNLDCAYPDYLVVSIRDTGVGMDEETAGRVFEPFFTTKELGKGTGLGLASSYGVVEAHRGTMEIESAPGRGTTVRIYLPLLRQESPTSPDGPYRALGDDQGRSKRIMVIDDEEIFLEACGDMLEALGYETVTFRSPRHAIERFREDHDDIDLVVIDMVMPGIAGGECFRRLKQIDPDIKALVATGHALEDAADRLLADGVAGFMRKPFVMEQLAEAVGRVLGAGD